MERDKRMSIQPEGEELRKATKWISDKLQYEKNQSLREVIEKACTRFNLSPKDAEYLMRFFSARDKG